MHIALLLVFLSSYHRPEYLKQKDCLNLIYEFRCKKHCDEAWQKIIVTCHIENKLQLYMREPYNLYVPATHKSDTAFAMATATGGS